MEQWTADQRKEFGTRLAKARKAKGLTQVEVGVIFEASKQTVSSWEKGRNLLSVEQLQILATEFGVSPEWLLLGEQATSWPFGAEVSQAEIHSLPEDLRGQAIGMIRVLVMQATERRKLQQIAA